MMNDRDQAAILMRFCTPGRAAIGLVLLIAAGFLGNYFRWTLFFNIDFLFGSIAVWLVVCLYGTRWGTLAGLVAGSCTHLIWHHPYTAITFTLEALFVGLLFHRRQQNIVGLDALYWLLIGMPLVWLFYGVVLHVEPAQVNIILLKQPINGIFNALVASLMMSYLPIHQWTARRQPIRTLSLQNTLFNFLVAFVLVPTLTLIILAGNQAVSDLKTTAQNSLDATSRYLRVEVDAWYQRRFQAMNELASIAAIAPFELDDLEKIATFAQQTFSDIHHIHIVDANNNVLLDTRHVETQSASSVLASHSTRFSEPTAHLQLVQQPWIEKLKQSATPFLSNVLVPAEKPASLSVILGIPILKDNRFIGAVLSEIGLNEISTQLKANIVDQDLRISLLDRTETVVASTQVDWAGIHPFDRRHGGDIDQMSSSIYHWLPNNSPLMMVRWNKSFFVQETQVNSKIPWTLIVEVSATPLVRQIEQIYTHNMMFLVVISGVALVFAVLISRQIVKPLTQLAVTTTDLPNKLLEREPIYWTTSQITEIARLVYNFRSMVATLKQKFWEIQQVNETLEQRVNQRTKELQKTNQNLEAEIAERQQAEIALRDSEERFRQMAENIQEVFWMRSVDGTLFYISPAYEDLWGRSCESLYAQPSSFFESVHPDDLPTLLSIPLDLDQHPINLEYRILKPDGTIRWVWDRMFPVQNEQGQIYRVVGVAQDITNRKQAEEAIQQQSERERLLGTIAQRIRQSLNLMEVLNTTVAEARQFLQTDRVIVYRFEPDWSGSIVVESVATGWKSILGKQIQDHYFVQTCGQEYRQGRIQATDDIYTAELSDCHIDLMVEMQVRANLVVPIFQGDKLWGLLVAQHCSTPRAWQAIEIDFLRQLATQAAIAIQQSELYQHEQQLNLILEGQVEERTAQLQQALHYEAMLKRITDKVRDSLDEEQILQTAVQELAEGLAVYGCNTALFNQSQATVTISHEYWVTSPETATVVTELSNFSDIYAQLLEGQCVQFCELLPLSHAHTATTILASPIIDDQGVLGILRLFRSSEDVFSEPVFRLVLQVANQCAIAIRQARLYQAAQVQVKALEELNQLKDDFLSTVSHELRTPISNMKLAIYMLKSVVDDDRRARYLDILQTECAREADLINDLLDLQRLASGTRALELETIHLQDWINQVIDPFRERIQNRQQTLQIDLADNLPAIDSDVSCLNRILAELLNNACKYTPPGEKILLTVQTTPTASWLHSYTPETSLANSGNVTAANMTSTNLASGELLELTVRNSGVEIPKAELSRIFEKFYRIPGVDRWKQGGTGLGLALVQKMAEHLGGAIQVESASNQTSFTITLPLTLHEHRVEPNL